MRLKIVVPRDEDELKENYPHFLKDTDPLQIKQKLSVEEYNALYDAEVWFNINQIAGTLLDAYEEDEITDMEIIMKVKDWLEHYLRTTQNAYEISGIKKMLPLFYEAERRKTGLIFIL